jgi:hypothetical protein
VGLYSAGFAGRSIQQITQLQSNHLNRILAPSLEESCNQIERTVIRRSEPLAEGFERYMVAVGRSYPTRTVLSRYRGPIRCLLGSKSVLEAKEARRALLKAKKAETEIGRGEA